MNESGGACVFRFKTYTPPFSFIITYDSMRKILLLAIAIIISFVNVNGQSADGRYVSRMTQDGTLYFIQPIKIKKLSGLKSFEYDMTLLNWTDSVTVNFTFESSMMQIPEKFKIISGSNTIACNSYSVLYLDIKKKHYEIRITSKFKASEIESVIRMPSPPIFSFSQENIQKSASYTQSAWNKDRKKLIDIFNLYNYSR